VVVIGRSAHAGWGQNERLAAKFIAALAQGLVDEDRPAEVRLPQPLASGSLR
jgi:hypothetical protein